MNASIDVPKIAMAVALQMMLCMVSNFTDVYDIIAVDDDLPPLCSFVL